MSVLGNNILIGASGQTSGDDPGGGGPTQFKSAEFIRENSSDLTRTFGSGGNRQKWTFSAWIKRQGNFGQVQRFFAVEGNETTDEDWFSVIFFSDNTILIGGYLNFFARGTQQFVDPGAYFHFVLAVDLSTTEKFKIFINNEEIELTLVTPPAETGINRSGADHFIGSEVGGAYFDGRMSNIQFVDSAYLTASDFGEYNSEGVWDHKQWGGSWGSTGFHLDFDDLSDLGKDAVGSKNWTPRNLSGSIDNPNNNFCTLNPLNSAAGTLSNLNRTYTLPTNAATRGTVAVPSGKYYFEVNLTTNGNPYIGICGKGQTTTASGGYVGDNGVALNRDGDIYYRYGGSTTYPGKSVKITTGVIGVAIDATSKKVWWSKNGTWYKFSTSTNQSCTIADVESGNFGFEFPLIEGDHFTVHLGNSSGNTSVFTLNSGEDGFTHTVPSGYKRLCTADLTSTISDGSEHFQARTRTGGGTTQTFTTLSPGLVWEKNRSSTGSHYLYDAVRGDNKYLSSNTTGSEASASGSMAFSANSYTVSSGFDWTSNNSIIDWVWNAGSSNTSIAVGGLNSLLYDQSQTWSNNWTASGNGFGSSGPANIFDTDTNNYLNNAGGGQVVTWDTTSYSLAGKLRINCWSSDGIYDVYVNGTKASDTPASRGWIDCGTFADINEIQFGGTSHNSSSGLASAGVLVHEIEVAGKTLINSGVTITNVVPSIASTVRANPSAGFSIITAKQAPQNGLGCTVGHGLGKAPDMYIVKDRDAGTAWGVYHKALGETKALQLNSANGQITTSGYFNDTEPTSIVLTVGAGVALEGDDFVVYAFSSVEGYSSIGSYLGNGSSDGSFIYTGFRPRWIMIKRTDANYGWYMYDTARDPYNTTGQVLLANDTAAEVSDSDLDILSNGFKLRRSSAAFNASGGSFIYISFASNPFKYSRAR